MSATHENRREFDKRKRPRRMYDALHGKATEEERQQYDKLLWSSRIGADRRTQERRRTGE